MSEATMSAIPSLVSLAIPVVAKNLYNGYYSDHDFQLGEDLGTLVYKSFMKKYKVRTQSITTDILKKLRVKSMDLDCNNSFNLQIASKQTQLERLGVKFEGSSKEKEHFTVCIDTALPTTHRKTIRSLSLSEKAVDWMLPMGNTFSNVTKLEITHCPILTKTDMRVMSKNFPKLKYLNVSNAKWLSLKNIERLKNLEVLIMRDANDFNRDGLRDILYLENLKVLDMSHTKTSETSTQIMRTFHNALIEEALKDKKLLPNLKVLFSICTDITLSVLEDFCRHFESLEYVNVIGSVRIDEKIGNTSVVGCATIEKCVEELEKCSGLNDAFIGQQILSVIHHVRCEIDNMELRIRIMATISKKMTSLCGEMISHQERMSYFWSMEIFEALSNSATLKCLDVATLQNICRIHEYFYRNHKTFSEDFVNGSFWRIFKKPSFFKHYNALDIKSIVSIGLKLISKSHIHSDYVYKTLLNIFYHAEYRDEKIGASNGEKFVFVMLGGVQNRFNAINVDIKRVALCFNVVQKSEVIRQAFLKSNIMSEWAQFEQKHCNRQTYRPLFDCYRGVLTMVAFLSKDSDLFKHFLKPDILNTYCDEDIIYDRNLTREQFISFSLQTIIANSPMSGHLNRDFVSRINELRSTLKPDADTQLMIRKHPEFKPLEEWVFAPVSKEPMMKRRRFF